MIELTKEFIEANNFTEEQVKALSPVLSEEVAKLKKDWDDAANVGAEKIMDGAAKLIADVHKVAPREHGEKMADFIARASESVVSKERESVKELKESYEKKLSELKGNGSEALQTELTKTKEALDLLQQKEAEFIKLSEAGYEQKYNDLLADHKNAVVTNAFGQVKPQFPETVNAYEAQAKWEKWVNDIKESHNIEISQDGTAVAVSKENEHLITPLSELLGKEASIAELVRGEEKPKGSGTNPVPLTQIKGVPFEVPKDADPDTRGNLIKEHLLKSGHTDILSDEYGQEWSRLNNLILSGGEKEEPVSV